jgi:hypothetical protein
MRIDLRPAFGDVKNAASELMQYCKPEENSQSPDRVIFREMFMSVRLGFWFMSKDKRGTGHGTGQIYEGANPATASHTPQTLQQKLAPYRQQPDGSTQIQRLLDRYL